MKRMENQIAASSLSRWPRLLGMAAVAAAFAFAVQLAVRSMCGPDIGYHLAYGERFLQTGHIVQTNEFIYTRFDPAILAEPKNLGPGNTYDAPTNTYHFINANWLSQVLMALAYRCGGVNALVVGQAVLVAGIFALLLAVLRQAGVGWPASAAAMLLAALVSYERFILRPELFGYVVLLAQWLLLSRRPFTRGCALRVTLLQVLAVNLHSYFLPSVALAGAMLADPLLAMAWAKWARGAPIASERKRQARWLGVALAGMVVACLANPWTWRGAVFPLQTLLYLQQNHIAGQMVPAWPAHPWAAIGELGSPFAPILAQFPATWAYCTMLGVVGIAAMAGLVRRRLDLLLAMVGMVSISLNMRRNLAASAIIAIPCAAAILHEARQRLADWPAQRRSGVKPKSKQDQRAQNPLPDKPLWSAWTQGIASALLLAAGLALSAWTVTNGLYFYEWRSWRFGTGWSRTTLPVSAAEWIHRHNPVGPVFADLDSSSNLMFLTQPHRQVPVLTNTWAYPPYLLGDLINLDNDKLDFDSWAVSRDAQVVVLFFNSGTPLLRRLAKSKDWAVVDLDVARVVFVRRYGPNAALAKAAEIRPESLDIDGFAAKVASADPIPAMALHRVALLLRHMGWERNALALWERCVAMRADFAEPRDMLGTALAWRGLQSLRRMSDAYKANQIVEGDRLKAQALADWQRARELFTEAMRLKRNFADAIDNLAHLESDMADFRNGRLAAPSGN